MSEDKVFPLHDAALVFGGPIDVSAAFIREAMHARREGFHSVADRFDQLSNDIREAIGEGKAIVIVLR